MPVPFGPFQVCGLDSKVVKEGETNHFRRPRPSKRWLECFQLLQACTYTQQCRNKARDSSQTCPTPLPQGPASPMCTWGVPRSPPSPRRAIVSEQSEIVCRGADRLLPIVRFCVEPRVFTAATSTMQVPPLVISTRIIALSESVVPSVRAAVSVLW